MNLSLVLLVVISLAISVTLLVGVIIFLFKVPYELENISKMLRYIQKSLEKDEDFT